MYSFNRLYNIIISAVCMGLAQHGFGLGWIAWFCLVPLFISIQEQNKFKKICFDAFVWGFVYHLTSIYWLVDNVGVDERYIAFITMLLANLICSVNIVFVFVIWHFINTSYGRKYWYSLPFIWVSVDYLASIGPIPFPWSSIANTQAQESLLFILQFIELTGMFGLTFWIIMINISLFYLYREKSIVRFIDSIGIFIAPFILGLLIYKNNYNDKEKIDFAIIQPNISIHNKRLMSSSESIEYLLDQSKSYLSRNNNRLLIWPETAFNHYNNLSDTQIKASLKGTNISLVTGVFEVNRYNIYNSIYYLNSSGSYSLKIAEKYRKIKMVPGAEYVPFSRILPFLNNIALSGNFTSGSEYKNFDYKNSKFGAMVCIESTYSSLSRKFVKNGAEFLIYVANDGWYEKPVELKQHAKQTMLRAIEVRKPVLRCGNTGISWVVSPRGDILKKLDLNTRGILSSENIEVYSNSEQTLYVYLGDWIAYLSIVIVLSLGLKGITRRVKK